MAYATSNPPALMTPRVGGGVAMWHYNHDDAATVVRVDGYITNAKELGMAIGDIIFQTDLTGNAVAHIYTVNAINANGSADLSNGQAIAVTDSD